MVQVWTSPSEKPETVSAFAKALSANVDTHKDVEFKGFLIMLTMCPDCEAKAAKFAEGAKIENIGIATLATTNRAIKAYRVNTADEVKNTIIVYRNKRVTAKFVNLTDSKEDLDKLEAAIREVTK